VKGEQPREPFPRGGNQANHGYKSPLAIRLLGTKTC
jgi:hypothetical protein